MSVITIVKNDAQGLLITASSVLKQDYPNLEWIVIDGLSRDGTAEYIGRLSARISKCIIEEDDGVYDAMNKGIDQASGDWIFFMNSDDIFFDSSTVSKYVKRIRTSDDIVYSDVVRREDGRINCYRPAEQYWSGMIFDHQTSCVRSDIYKTLRYDENYKVNGDFDLFSRAHVSGLKFRKLAWVIGCRKPFMTGVSADYLTRQYERIQVIRKYFNELPWRHFLEKEFVSARKSNLIDIDAFDSLVKLLEK